MPSQMVQRYGIDIILQVLTKVDIESCWPSTKAKDSQQKQNSEEYNQISADVSGMGRSGGFILLPAPSYDAQVRHPL